MAAVLQITGLTAITVGALLVSVPLGVILGGVFLTAVGYSLGRS